MNKTLKLFALAGLGLAVSQCTPTPEEENESELITTVRLVLTDSQDASNTATVEWQDLDGVGGDDPTVGDLTLMAGTTYNATIEFLDESGDAVEDITEEVEEEGDEHQVFYVPAAGLNLTFTYGDMDSADNPIGIETTMTTGAASTGALTVTLRHEPDKAAAGVSDGDITNAGGETDVTVDFDVTIQ